MKDLSTDQWNELDRLVRTAARRVAAQWPDVIETEDLAQDMLVGLLERPGALRRVFEEDDHTRQAFLIKFAHQTASDEQTAYDRYSGNYLYNSGEVRGYLDNGAINEANPTKFVAEISDLQEGLSNLADSGSPYYAEIINRYVHEIIPEGSTERSRLFRAVDALTEQMNRIGAERRKKHIEGPGTRTVISNGSAIGVTQVQNEQGFDMAYKVARSS